MEMQPPSAPRGAWTGVVTEVVLTAGLLALSVTCATQPVHQEASGCMEPSRWSGITSLAGAVCLPIAAALFVAGAVEVIRGLRHRRRAEPAPRAPWVAVAAGAVVLGVVSVAALAVSIGRPLCPTV